MTATTSPCEGLLHRVLENLEERHVVYCILRDGDQLNQLSKGGEIDLLVQEDHFEHLRNVLSGLGFVQLPSLGYAPHKFFVAYDSERDAWLKCDVVTRVAFGRPIRSLATSLAENCLRNRRPCGETFLPSPEDELVALLLHCVLDKAHFSLKRSQRLQTLRQQISNEQYLSCLLTSYWSPSVTWQRLAELIDADDWETLLAERRYVSARLMARNRLGTFMRAVGGRLLRKVPRWIPAPRPHNILVALLAPDGAGKSTLVGNIATSFYFPVRSVYMGLYQNASSTSRSWRLPGIGFAASIFKQWWRYLTARFHRGMGRLVICDRYTYDALLPTRRHLNWLKRCRRRILSYACPSPDLVILLDAPGQVLYSRKGEHTAAILEEQRQGYLEMRRQFPQIIVVDATHDSEDVRREVTSLIWKRIAGQPRRRCANEFGAVDIGATFGRAIDIETQAPTQSGIHDVALSKDYGNLHLVRDSGSGATRSGR